MRLLRLQPVAVQLRVLLREEAVRCSAHCPPAGGGGRLAAAVIGLAAIVAAVAGISAVIGDILLAIAALLAVAVTSGTWLLVHLLRQPVALYAPQSPAALPATQSPRLTASVPAAISTARRNAVITGLILNDSTERPAR